jgi:competence protein ComGC
MSDVAGGAEVTPNWYPDPGGSGLLRYWDGFQWTAHTAPAAGVGTAPLPPARKGSNKALWIMLSIVVGIPVVLVIVGIIAAIAIPVFLNQRAKAEDTAAKSDVSTLGVRIATWTVDHADGLPAVTAVGGKYFVDDVPVAAVSRNVEFGDITGTGADDWCVWVANPKGDVKYYEYSSALGLREGSC